MGRAILAEPDRIMCVNVDDVPAHDARQSDWRPHVVGEDEKSRAVRYDAAGQRHSIHDGSHSVLANPKMEIATGITLGGEAGLALDDRVRRASEIGGAADQLRDLAGDSVDYDARGSATRHISIFGRKRRKSSFPSVGKIAAQTALKLLFEPRIRRLVSVVNFVPSVFRLCSPFARFTPIGKRFGSNKKGLLRRVSKGLLGELDLFDPERRAMRLGRVVLVGASVTDVSANDDH